eukprot:CAMPEP_0184401010 /NCGR_PEP_ID=MMETSP0007-20130409/77242_1 /TAXON_ID=97485 /ORGANISM="Prymnesium parvum, Strain Texoma1" /LENGTH=32 /DNA_ID= /DNA_START= /DNA_END= /DNA_ORIENTATION=
MDDSFLGPGGSGDAVLTHDKLPSDDAVFNDGA